MSSKEKIFECNKCKSKFNNNHDLRSHEWTYHPKNKIESVWSKYAKENFKNYNGSSYYESFGPYY